MIAADALAGLRLAVGLLSVLPVREPRVDRATAGWAMTLAPLVGALLGTIAAAVAFTVDAVALSVDAVGAVDAVDAGPARTGGLLSAALAVGALALLTRGLHLDGLADLADGLGSGKPAGQALEVMKRSDIGPFGVITLVFTLLVQVAALDRAGPVALITACATGRLAITWACAPGVPAARPSGLGALVAGTVRPWAAVTATGALLAAAALAGADAALAVPAGLAAAWLLRRRAVRRLGGVTGDVLGALCETATTTALLVCALA